ncbi:MAG: hypothetical protein U0Y08_14530 [Bacteroidia bacterium]
MNSTLRNILAVIAGAVIGSFANGGLIALSPSLIPPPAGADVTTVEGLKASLHLFEPRHFIMPFLAHAVGTLVGAFIAALIAVNNKMRTAMIVGALFMVGGIMNVFMLPAPTWFCVTDLLLAYLPMAYLGGRIGAKK